MYRIIFFKYCLYQGQSYHNPRSKKIVINCIVVFERPAKNFTKNNIKDEIRLIIKNSYS